ncbi:response regulator transcription factor [Ideonella sp. DXS29W]|uniref:Response regulator transcription factor n=1 Tax=Ideonella lacteola TaxID=2984193 RepID=A0ABU9BZ14_9BURK
MRIAAFTPDSRETPSLLADLAERGHCVDRFHETSALLRHLARDAADVLVMVEPLGGVDEPTWNLARLLRERADAEAGVPVVMFAGAAAPSAMARAFEAGVDDVIGQHMSQSEVEGRLLAAGSQSTRRQAWEAVQVAGYCLGRPSRHVSDRGTPIRLTAREFELAWLLFSHAGQCVARQTLSLAVWGAGCDITGRTMEEHMYRLRRKLRLTASRGVTLHAVYGRGYQLVVDQRWATSCLAA